MSICYHQFIRLEPEINGGIPNTGESKKAERWLLHSLQVHMLSAQLRPLLRHLGHTRKYYNSECNISQLTCHLFFSRNTISG